MISEPTILITGASGFLGQIISEELKNTYRRVSLSKSSKEISCDLSIEIPTLPRVDFVIHAAGKAHIIPRNNQEIEAFNQVNYQGTVNLIKALEDSGLPIALTYISSVAVYGAETGRGIKEDHPLMGSTPYAESKIATEEYLIDWGQKNNVKITILRLPLIAGPNPPGNLGAMKKAIAKGYYFRLGRGDAQKSMVWGGDVAKIIPNCFKTAGIFNLTDGLNPTIRELDNAISARLKRAIGILPLWLVSFLAFPSRLLPLWPINKTRIYKLTSSLTFSSEKAVQQLGWQPRSVIECIKEYGI